MFNSKEAMDIVHRRQGQQVPPTFGSELSEENRIHLFLNSVGGLQKQVDELSQQSFILPPSTRPLNAQERHWLATHSANDIIAVRLPEEPDLFEKILYTAATVAISSAVSYTALELYLWAKAYHAEQASADLPTIDSTSGPTDPVLDQALERAELREEATTAAQVKTISHQHPVDEHVNTVDPWEGIGDLNTDVYAQPLEPGHQPLPEQGPSVSPMTQQAARSTTFFDSKPERTWEGKLDLSDGVRLRSEVAIGEELNHVHSQDQQGNAHYLKSYAGAKVKAKVTATTEEIGVTAHARAGVRVAEVGTRSTTQELRLGNACFKAEVEARISAGPSVGAGVDAAHNFTTNRGHTSGKISATNGMFSGGVKARVDWYPCDAGPNPNINQGGPSK